MGADGGHLHLARHEIARTNIAPSHPDFSKAKPFRTDRRATHFLTFFANIKHLAAKMEVRMAITHL
jgi:hypothetical protein